MLLPEAIAIYRIAIAGTKWPDFRVLGRLLTSSS